MFTFENVYIKRSLKIERLQLIFTDVFKLFKKLEIVSEQKTLRDFSEVSLGKVKKSRSFHLYSDPGAYHEAIQKP